MRSAQRRAFECMPWDSNHSDFEASDAASETLRLYRDVSVALLGFERLSDTTRGRPAQPLSPQDSGAAAVSSSVSLCLETLSYTYIYRTLYYRSVAASLTPEPLWSESHPLTQRDLNIPSRHMSRRVTPMTLRYAGAGAEATLEDSSPECGSRGGICHFDHLTHKTIEVTAVGRVRWRFKNHQFIFDCSVPFALTPRPLRPSAFPNGTVSLDGRPPRLEILLCIMPLRVVRDGRPAASRAPAAGGRRGEGRLREPRVT
ncbi:hypothetical protein EVAR_27126_1 [Eumeta japonica]|uniref:Uncharacterized protein n=1 Tax=Eumeta variegata TaxID=151549 RepID=A0A4C1VY51_EUMVA|nr:hypothetical protein EVAR_27126_1 [Eumeta japonica]